MSETINRRILVLGTTPHPGVTSYAWNDLPQGLSVADYDVLVLNLAIFEESEDEHWVDSHSLPPREQIARLLFSAGEVVVLGSPNLTLRNVKGVFGVDWWLPFFLDVHQEYGTEINISDEDFSYYFPYVSQWNAFVRQKFQHSFDPGEYARIVTQEGVTTEYGMRPLAHTRFGEAVAFAISMVVKSQTGQSVKYSGPVFWLPRADKLNAYEAAELILKARYNVLVGSDAPAWAEPFTLPREESVRHEIAVLEAQISEMEASLNDAYQRLKHEARFSALLYERGDALEKLVRDAFRELGAEVEERPKDREDGRLTDPSGRQAIIEIKGRTGAAKLSDIRQLHHWVGDAIAEEDWEGKGILIVNAFADDPVGQRGEPFPANSVRAAERFDLCLLTTTQLFAAIRAQQQGSFDSDAFWGKIFQATGLCDLPELSEVAQTATSALDSLDAQ